MPYHTGWRQKLSALHLGDREAWEEAEHRGHREARGVQGSEPKGEAATEMSLGGQKSRCWSTALAAFPRARHTLEGVTLGPHPILTCTGGRNLL